MKNYPIEYTEEDDAYEIDLVDSDLYSVKNFFTDVLEENKSIFGRVLAYLVGLESPKLEEDVKKYFEEFVQDYTQEELTREVKQIESQKEKSLLTLQESKEKDKIINFTQLMALKYVFELEQVNPGFKVNSDNEYNTDLTLEGDDLREATHENIVKLQKDSDIDLWVTIGKELVE